MKKTLLSSALLILFLAGCAPAGEQKTDSSAPPASTPTEPKPGFKNVVLTDDENTKSPKSSFTPDTPKIFVFWDLEKVPSGSKLKGVWICEKSEGIAPDFKIDEATVDVGTIDNSGNFSISKPNKGWPIGDYRVELWWDTNKAEEVKFNIAK